MNVKTSLNIGVIGLGGRGYGLLKGVMLHMEDINIVAVCDLYPDRAEQAAEEVKEKKGNTPFVTGNYQEILAMPEVDAVIVSTSWRDHFKICIAAMKAGKYAASEVGGAYSLDQCWELVRTHEETGVPCMMLENCCYGREELMVLNMVKQGAFGEVVHCRGGYHHDLRDEISDGRENRHYRLENYLNRNCENYPTHELGPISKILNINRGNRLTSLVSMASKAAGLHDYLLREKGADHDLTNATFQQGDVVTTIVRCALGQTIVLTLDTTLPRAYSRGFTVQGTRAMYQEENNSMYIDTKENLKLHFTWKDQWNNAEQFREQYEHPIWKRFLNDGVKGGHGGMDWLVFRAFFESVMAGEQTPIDVYDFATWASISALSEKSIQLGGAPVEIPDFTEGKWINRPVERTWNYSLSEIGE